MSTKFQCTFLWHRLGYQNIEKRREDLPEIENDTLSPSKSRVVNYHWHTRLICKSIENIQLTKTDEHWLCFNKLSYSVCWGKVDYKNNFRCKNVTTFAKELSNWNCVEAERNGFLLYNFICFPTTKQICCFYANHLFMMIWKRIFFWCAVIFHGQTSVRTGEFSNCENKEP